MKKILTILCSLLLCIQISFPVLAEEVDTPEDNSSNQTVEIQSPSAILMEMSTGQILYEKDADTQRPPASVTKIMTMLLIFDALESGKISLEDEVVTSEYAASMGGSQVFLEPGEIQTVDTMLKCIAVASANDGCVAMAEHIAGSEEAFVKMMNERAAGLGMKNTQFHNVNGLDAEGHVITARDIALMSRELMTKYPQIQNYCTIWMDTITHTTSKGSQEFGLSNTNKLIRQYQYATGLKTGSTSEAKFCVSATAKKDNIELIAVIMAAENSKQRFQDATTLLNYGFGQCQIYEEQEPPKLHKIPVEGGVEEELSCSYSDTFRYLDTEGRNLSGIKKTLQLKDTVEAPIEKGEQVGELIYELDGQKVGSVAVVASHDVSKASYWDYLKKVVSKLG